MITLQRRWRIGPIFVAALMCVTALANASGASAQVERAQSKLADAAETTSARSTPALRASLATDAADDAAAHDAPGIGDLDGVSRTQLVALRVNPGELKVSDSAITVVLTPGSRPGVFRGSVRDIFVIDARGSLVGWTIEARILDEHADVLSARIEPDRPHVVAGDALDAVAAGPATTIDAIHWTTIGRAAPGGGGGTYAVTAELSLRGQFGATAPRSVLLALRAR